MAEWISVIGTRSDVGKTVITAALCSLLSKKGYSVAPFKPVNYSLNAFPTDNKKEIGYGTKYQAKKANRPISKEMNPLLVKMMENKTEIVGKKREKAAYNDLEREIKDQYEFINKCAEKLDEENDYVIHEGFGSAINANLSFNPDRKIADKYNAEIVVTSDISKGGAEASLFGTINLLPDLKEQIELLFVNKIHPESRRKKKVKEFVERKTGKNAEIIEFINGLKTPPEDGKPEFNGTGEIAVIDYPYASNLTDLWKLPKAKTQYVKKPEQLRNAKLIILPGSKDTIKSLQWMKKKDFESKLKKTDAAILGICGGFQILTEKVSGSKAEKDQEVEGIGLIAGKTEYRAQKICRKTEVEFKTDKIQGYEIRYGRSIISEGEKLFSNRERNIGVKKNNIIGTYIHDCLTDETFEKWILDRSDVEFEHFDDNYDRFQKAISKKVEKHLSIPD